MKSTILTATIFLSFLSIGNAQQKLEDKIPTIGASMWLNTLMKATMNNDIGLFRSVCDENMNKAISKDKLAAVSKQISLLMKEGYKKIFFGVLDRNTHKTYYWKIDFDKEGAPDVLVELSISRKKVSGFLIR